MIFTPLHIRNVPTPHRNTVRNKIPKAEKGTTRNELLCVCAGWPTFTWFQVVTALNRPNILYTGINSAVWTIRLANYTANRHDSY